jgi:Archaeal/vacuolar-type H+-ATPase subunit B
MKEYQTITEISGPLVFAAVDEPIGYDEIVEIETPDGELRRGQVLESQSDLVAIQVFEGTTGIDRNASVRFLGETLKLKVTEDLLGRVLSGSGQPIDGARRSSPMSASRSSARRSTRTRASTPRSSSRRASPRSTG